MDKTKYNGSKGIDRQQIKMIHCHIKLAYIHTNQANNSIFTSNG